MKKKYLVTGGAGFLGSALVKRLIVEGHVVRVLDDFTRGNPRRLKGFEKHVEWFKGDIRNASLVKRAVRGVDAVWHLAFINGTEFFYTKPELVLDVGVRGMVNVLDACIERKIPELFLASSSEVYQTPPVIPTPETTSLTIPDPLNPRYSYAGGKMISELMALNAGRRNFQRVVVFRPHNVYGPDMGHEHVIPQIFTRLKKMAHRKKRGVIRLPIQGSGKETRSFVFIEDFIDGLMILRKSGKHMGIYHVGTMDEISIAELVRKIGSFFSRTIQVVPGKAAIGGTKRRCPDIRKMVSLGYRPCYSLDEGLAVTLNWYDEN